MLQRHKFKVHRLHPRPQQKVIRHAGHPRLLQSLFGTASLKICHRGKETRHVDGREDELVAGDARGDGAVRGGGVHARGEEAVPFCRGGTEDRYGGGFSAKIWD